MIDMAMLIAQNKPDVQGTTMPGNVHEGSAQLAGSQAENQHILVSMDAGTYNVNKAICGVECQNCNGYTGFGVIDDPFGLPVSGNKQETFYGQWDGGSQYNLSANWSSNNTPVVIVGSSNGLVSGVSPGSVTISAADIYFTEPYYYPNFCTDGNVPCPSYTQPGASSSGSVCDRNTRIRASLRPRPSP